MSIMVEAWLDANVVTAETLKSWFEQEQDPLVSQDGVLKQIVSTSEEDDDDEVSTAN